MGSRLCPSPLSAGPPLLTPRASRLLLVDPLLEALARLERQHLACGDLDAVPRLGVASTPRSLPPDAEVAEAYDLHVLALLEAAEDDVEQRLDYRGGLPLGQAVGGHRVDEIVLRQCCHLPSIRIGTGPQVPEGLVVSSAGRALRQESRNPLGFELGACLLRLGAIGIAAHAHHVERRAARRATRRGRGRRRRG